MTNPAAQTAPATLAADIETAVRRAIEAATSDSEHVVGYRVVQAGHLVVWLDLEAGKRARFAVWDGSLVISRQTRARSGLRALRVHSSEALVQDWTEVASCPPVTRDQSSDPLRVVPCTISRAQAFVATHHRHHDAPQGGLWAVAVEQGEILVGVAIVGRPVARALQDGATCEVTRVCTLGDRNACSMLLAACRRAAIALGFHRLITYTLASEPGASLRGAGWREVARVRGRSWACASRPRAAHDIEDKIRWEAHLGGSPTPAAPPSTT